MLNPTRRKAPRTPRFELDSNITFFLAFLAFVISYSKLVELAERAGYSENMAHLWPLIVDGVAVVATRGAMKLNKPGYAVFLLVASTVVSIVAAVAQTVFPDGPLDPAIAAAVSVVPPLCLLATPHLAVQLRKEKKTAADTTVAASKVATSSKRGNVATSNTVATKPQVNTNVATPKVDVAPTKKAVATPKRNTDVAPDRDASTATETPVDVAPKTNVDAANASSNNLATVTVAQQREERRELALHLLRTTDMSLREIAAKVGASDMSVGRWGKAAGIDTSNRAARRSNRNATLSEVV